MVRWITIITLCTSAFMSSNIFAFGTSQSGAQYLESICGTAQKVGEHCHIGTEQLHPTQLTFGAIEVDSRSFKIATMSPTKLQKYIDAHIVPVVIGPDGSVYITDHHHFAMAMAKAFGATTEISAVVVQNWSEKSAEEFWRLMDKQSYTYLYDENGVGPKSPRDLPKQIFDLKNDSFRSLAWAVSNGGGYETSAVPHADFLWANFFRLKILKDAIDNDFENTVLKAIPMAHSDDAKTLPGYLAE
ncbi:MAG: hypothetical protein H7249_12170 [Chitinophagaceae bacterium]|nr:hypothetical protein [Oligoflexus sp.]